MATMKLKKRNNLSDLEKELFRLYDEAFRDGRDFQTNAMNPNRRVHPADRSLRRIVNLLKVD